MGAENGVKIGSDQYWLNSNNGLSALLKMDDNSKAILVQGNCKYIIIASTSKVQSASSLKKPLVGMLDRLCAGCPTTLPKPFTKGEIADLEKKFAAADTSGNGLDNVTQLSDLIASVGQAYYDPLAAELNDTFKTYNNKIDVSAFLKIMREGKKEDDKKKQVRNAFRTYDQDGDGYVTINELDNPPASAPANLYDTYGGYVDYCCQNSPVNHDGYFGDCYYQDFFNKMIDKVC